MSESKRPIPESYWVLPDRFLAGEYPARVNEELSRKQIDRFLEAGFDLFIDLTRTDETRAYADTLRQEAEIYNAEVSYRRFPVGDFGLPTPDQMNAILDVIDAGLQAGQKIYLHCWGGIGRTGTTVGCYLVRRGKTGAEALRQLATWWRDVPKSRYHPYSPETLEQMNFILDWAEHDQSQK
jgi:hypothetical protein